MKLFLRITFLSLVWLFFFYSLWLNFFPGNFKPSLKRPLVSQLAIPKEAAKLRATAKTNLKPQANATELAESQRSASQSVLLNQVRHWSRRFSPLEKVQFSGLLSHWLAPTMEVLAPLGVVPGASLLFLDKLKIKHSLEQLSYVDQAKVELHLPSTLKLSVKAPVGKFIVKAGAVLLLIDQEGGVVAPAALIPSFDHFFIEPSDPMLPPEKNKQVTHFLQLFKQLSREERNLAELYSGIDFTSAQVSLYSKNQAIRTILGPTLSLPKLRKAYYAYLYQSKKQLKVTRIDLSAALVRYSLGS